MIIFRISTLLILIFGSALNRASEIEETHVGDQLQLRGKLSV